MKISPLEAELFHADEQTDMTMLIVAFRNFENAPNNTLYIYGPVSYPHKTGETAALSILPPSPKWTKNIK